MKITRTIAVGSAGLLALGGSIFGLSIASAASASAPATSTTSVQRGANLNVQGGLNVQSGTQDTTGVDVAVSGTETTAEATTPEATVSDGVGGSQDVAGTLGLQGGAQL